MWFLIKMVMWMEIIMFWILKGLMENIGMLLLEIGVVNWMLMEILKEKYN